MLETDQELPARYAPWRVWKNRRGRRPSQRKANATATDSRCQLKGCVRTGVSPRGAQVRRTTGTWEMPLSSSKTSQARWRRAFFFTCPFHLVDPGTLGPAAALGRGASDTTDSLAWTTWLHAKPPKSGFQRTEAHAPPRDVNVAVHPAGGEILRRLADVAMVKAADYGRLDDSPSSGR